jgi:hypothetical protein
MGQARQTQANQASSETQRTAFQFPLSLPFCSASIMVGALCLACVCQPPAPPSRSKLKSHFAPAGISIRLVTHAAVEWTRRAEVGQTQCHCGYQWYGTSGDKRSAGAHSIALAHWHFSNRRLCLAGVAGSLLFVKKR